MKKINLLTFLLFSLVLISSCNNEGLDSENPPEESIDYQALRVSSLEQARILVEPMKSKKGLSQAMADLYPRNSKENLTSRSQLVSIVIEYDDPKSQIGLSNRYYASDISDIFSQKQRVFLAEYYSEMYDTKFERLDNVIDKYRALVDSKGFSSTEKSQILTTLDTNETTVLVIDEAGRDAAAKMGYDTSRGGWWDCFKKNGGKAIGRGMAAGAIQGAITGAMTGAAGGTVAFPGLGTATGAVGGAVFGGAAGALRGAIVGAIWTAADCTTGGGAASTAGSCSSQTSGDLVYEVCSQLVDSRNAR